MTVNVPQDFTAVAFNLDEAPRATGPWSTIQAGLTAGASTLTITARFHAESKFFRLLWVADGGSPAGLHETDAIPLASANVTSTVPTGPLRKFTCGERDWLEEHGIDWKLAASYPRGWTVAQIRDAIDGN